MLTLHDGQSFPYGATPPGATSAVLPDAGTVVAEPLAYDATGEAAARTGTSAATKDLVGGLSNLRAHGMSNAVVVSGRHHHRQPGGRVRPADRLLRPARSCSRNSRGRASARAARRSPG
ncbi:hypothetical protein V2I01_36755 [Micromonospora sp. BRA006-A]|nr:hypothetical protein [Micromonospora sp. BRA006-A]